MRCVPRQLFEQDLCFFQVRRVEPFRKPAVDREEEFVGFRALALVAPEAGEADAGAEFFKELRSLTLCNFDCIAKGCSAASSSRIDK
jgi:hypothetical protein